MLSAHIMDGKAQIRVPIVGEWMVSVLVKKDVRPDNELRALVKFTRECLLG